MSNCDTVCVCVRVCACLASCVSTTFSFRSLFACEAAGNQTWKQRHTASSQAGGGDLWVKDRSSFYNIVQVFFLQNKRVSSRETCVPSGEMRADQKAKRIISTAASWLQNFQLCPQVGVSATLTKTNRYLKSFILAATWLFLWINSSFPVLFLGIWFIYLL